MQLDDEIRVRHMVDAAETALQFAAGRVRSDLDTDRMLLFAVLHAIEMLGEAAARLSDQVRAVHAEIPWWAIIGMRNRLVQGYFDVDTEIVWRTLTDELPGLLHQLQRLHANAEDETGNRP